MEKILFIYNAMIFRQLTEDDKILDFQKKRKFSLLFILWRLSLSLKNKDFLISLFLFYKYKDYIYLQFIE